MRLVHYTSLTFECSVNDDIIYILMRTIPLNYISIVLISFYSCSFNMYTLQNLQIDNKFKQK